MLRALTLWAVATALAACAPPLEAFEAEPYEACHRTTLGEPCGRGPTTCREAPVFEWGVAMCTTACEVDDDCHPRTGHTVRCEQFTEGRLCVVACQGDHDLCPLGTVCRNEERINGESVRFCAPD